MAWEWVEPTPDDFLRFSAAPTGEFVYPGKIASSDDVYDADTIKNISIDLGFRTFHTLDYARLYGINAPEVRGAERSAGLAARNWVREQIEDAAGRFLIKSWKGKKGKYGRWLGEIFVPGRNLNLELCKRGLANVNFYD